MPVLRLLQVIRQKTSEWPVRSLEFPLGSLGKMEDWQICIGKSLVGPGPAILCPKEDFPLCWQRPTWCTIGL
jgi:hypothetical protein